MTLFHTGTVAIAAPDVRRGRANADFGQGFYLSGDEEFSRRWARGSRNAPPVLNRYGLDTDGLVVRRFARDDEWFSYITANRARRPDAHADADVIIGPIANDTIFETFGFLTSGLFTPEQVLRVLSIGPAYEQVTVKSERGARALRFLGAETLTESALVPCREALRREEAAFQYAFGAMLKEFSDEEAADGADP